MIKLRRAAGISALLVLVAAPALAQERPDRTRVDLYRPDATRKGHVIVDQQTGRVGTFDERSRRTGWGRIERDGRIDLYRNDGTRAGSATLPAHKPVAR